MLNFSLLYSLDLIGWFSIDCDEDMIKSNGLKNKKLITKMQSITREASCIWGLDFFLLGLAEDFLMVGVFLGDGVDDKEW
jgi:hypothetical protein